MMKEPRSRRALTLAEMVVATALIVGGGGILLAGMHYADLYAQYLHQYQVAIDAAQGLLERLAATDFGTLTGPPYAAARAGIQRCLVWDLNCNGAADAGETPDAELLPGGALDVQIRQPAEDALINPLVPALLDVYVAACWRSRERPVGEDRNCDGTLDPGEDLNGNGWVDSPVMVSTRVGRSG